MRAPAAVWRCDPDMSDLAAVIRRYLDQTRTTPETPMPSVIDSLLTVARADGLTPVIEAEGTVDLRIMDGDRIVAAIRVHLGDDWCVHEIPARTGGADLENPLSQPWTRGEFQPHHLRDLDMWWSRVPGAGRSWRPARESWMRSGHWQRRGILQSH